MLSMVDVSYGYKNKNKVDVLVIDNMTMNLRQDCFIQYMVLLVVERLLVCPY